MEDLHRKIIHNTDFRLVSLPVYHDCCVHCLCTGGNATFHYFENDFTFGSNRMAVISYPDHLSDIEVSDDFECEYIIAPRDFLHALLPANNYSIPGCVALTINPIMEMNCDDMARLHSDFAAIASRIKYTGHLFYREMIGNLLRTMIYDIFDIHARRDGMALQTSRVGYVVTHFISMIREGEPLTHREPSWYADKLNITVKYLGDTVRRITGASASEHINRAASAILREYIETTDLTISQIAERMNFSSLSYLNRFCKLHLGKSPTELRRLKGNTPLTSDTFDNQ